MKAEYDITATITFFCLLEKRSYTSFGLPSIVSTSETSSLSLCGVSTKNFAQLPFPSLSGGFPRRFLSNAISSIFEHDIEGLESGPRVSDELFCSSILSCVKVTDGVDSSMGVELELLAVFMLSTAIRQAGMCFYGSISICWQQPTQLQEKIIALQQSRK